MDKQPQNSASVARPFSVGVTLRETREKLGLSVPDVANRLKFAPRQIEALEEDNFARLPEMAFVRGFVRSYARLLQLDPNPLLAALPQSPIPVNLTAVNSDTEVRFPDAHARKQNFMWLAAGLGLAAVLGLFVWMNDSPPQATQVETLSLPPVTSVPASEVPAVALPFPASSVATPSVAAAAPKAPPPLATKVPTAPKASLVGPPVPPSVKGAGNVIKGAPLQSNAGNQGLPVRLVFEQDSWVEVTDKNGIYLMAQLNLSGTERRVRGIPPFHLTIGNASGVRLYYYEKSVDLAPFNKAGVAHLTLE